jgi:hypothetical protein
MTRWTTRIERAGRLIGWVLAPDAALDAADAVLEARRDGRVQEGDSLTVYAVTAPTTLHLAALATTLTDALAIQVEFWERRNA